MVNADPGMSNPRLVMGYVRGMSDIENAADDAPSAELGAAEKPPAIDRYDRRFRIDGNAAEALRVVVADRSGRRS